MLETLTDLITGSILVLTVLAFINPTGGVW